MQDRVRVNKRHDVAHNRFKIHDRKFEIAFSDQFAHPADDFTRAAIVFHDVLKDGPELSDIRRVGSKETLRGLGVAEDRRERLIQLMRQRRRELAHRGDSRYVSEFVALPLHYWAQ